MDAEGKINPGLFVEPGVLIAGRFEVVDRVGAGGVGMVYRAIDRELDGEVVALKLLLPHLAQDEQVYRRFRNEVLVARSLSHPNIVRTHDMGRAENGFSYISMEFVDGVSLKEKLGDDGSVKPALTFDQALGILYQIISGVAYAHGKGIIHRDLKPANVLISKKGEVKLADFGTARILGMDTSLTQTGQVIGTPDYMSPEQIRGEPLDQACDIYALGIIAYELVVGVKPFIADSAVAIAFKHLNEPIPPFASPQKGVPGWYENVVRTATAKKKDDRFVSVMEFAAVLLDYAPQLSVQSTFFTVDRNTARSSAHYPKVEESSETPTGERRAVPKNTSNGAERGFELGNALDSGDTGTGWKLGFDSGESAAAAATNEALRVAKKKPAPVMSVLAVAGIFALGLAAWFVPPLHRASHNIFVMLGLELPTPVGGSQTQVAFDQPTSNTVDTVPVVKEPEVVAPVAAVVTPEPKITPESKQPEKAEVPPSVVAANQKAPEATTTAVPEPPAPAKLEANLALRSSSGSQNETTFSVDRLGELRWFLTLSGPADGWTAEKIREVYALNVVDTKKAALVSKVPLEKVQMPAKGESNVRLQGDFAAWKRARPSVGRYRVDVIQAGEVVASREIELFRASVVASDSGANTAGAGGTVTIVRGASASGEPTEVRPVEPPVSEPPVANTYVPEPTPQSPVATSGGLPVAKGHENSINEARPTNVVPPIQSGSVASSGGTEVIQGSSVGAANVGNQTPPPVAADEVPAVHEVYGGFMTIARENSMGDERRPIILNLDFRGAQISGSAEIAGYGNLTVSGRVHPRGLDIELSNSETWMRLSSGQRERQLRGRYSIPKEQKKGAFEVSRTGG